MTFETCSGKGKDLDPEVQKLVRKVGIIKRVMAKHPVVQHEVKTAVTKYSKRGKQGTIKEGKKQSAQIKSLGPIGMLIEAIADNNAQIDNELDIKQLDEQDISILHTPWGVIQDLTENLARRARIAKASAHRDFLGASKKLTKLPLEKLYRTEHHRLHHNGCELGQGET